MSLNNPMFLKKLVYIPKYIIKKSKLEEYFYKRSLDKQTRSIPIDQIRCQIKPFSELQGFSGKPIEYFPLYNIFKTSLRNSDLAFNSLCKWLYFCLIELKGWKITKTDGGWNNGSLYRLIFTLHENNGSHLTYFEDALPELITQAIHQRANYYLDLFTYLKENSHKKGFYEPIICHPINEEDLYIIHNGHHRTAALKLLGFDNINVVLTHED